MYIVNMHKNKGVLLMEINIYKEVKKLIDTNNIKDLRTFININNNLISKKDFIEIVQNYIKNEIDAGLKIVEKNYNLYFEYNHYCININDLKLKPYAFNLLYDVNCKELLNILSMEKMHFIIRLLLNIEFKNIDVVNYINYNNDINIINADVIKYQNKVFDIINNMELPQDIKKDIIKKLQKN